MSAGPYTPTGCDESASIARARRRVVARWTHRRDRADYSPSRAFAASVS